MNTNVQASTQSIQKSFHILKSDKNWSFKHIAREDTNAYTHGYHRYPAKFIPQIVEQLIQLYAPNGNEIVCDPFGGCGTTLVESKIMGRKSIGFDINPIAKLITQVKITPIKPQSLNYYRKQFLILYKKTQSKNKINHHPRIKYWFHGNTVKSLDKIYNAIIKIKDQKVRNFFLCAFSHILKNNSRWLMKSIKPTIDKNKMLTSPIMTFLKHLDKMIKKNSEFYYRLTATGHLKVSSKMYRRDSTRNLPIKSNSIDLIITSPPYVTSYEYADLHQLTLLWFGDDKTHFKKWSNFSNGFDNFRKQFIGSNHKRTNKNNFNSQIAENIINKIESSDKTLARSIANYFLDMKKVFEETHRILKKGGKTCLIVGNTQLRGVKIQNAEVAVEQMSKIGFHKIEYVKREISNKMITPWRDKISGKFTSHTNPNKKRVYECEYIIVMEK